MITNTTLQKFLEYINYISENSEKLTIKNDVTHEELILGNLSCLLEEVGETSAEVRKLTKLSFSQKKVNNFQKEDLEDELVDVLITTLLLTKSVGITNLDAAIQRKIEKNNKRGY